MYILKNALRSIFRAKGRNILIVIIVFVIAVSSCVALSIRQAANKEREELLKGKQITATISVNRSEMMKNFKPGSNKTTSGGSFDRNAFKEAFNGTGALTLDEMQKYASLPSVKEFYYTISVSMSGTDSFNPVDTTSDSSSASTSSDTSSSSSAKKSNTLIPGEGGPGEKFGGMMGNQGDFTVIGYCSDNAMTNFKSGSSSISQGSMFAEGTEEMECVISDELASYNSISVDSTITLVNPNNTDETYPLKVVGIYKNTQSTVTDSNMMVGFSTANDPANRILTSYKTLNKITTQSTNSATTETNSTTGRTTNTALRSQTSGTYVFETIDNYDSFASQAKAAGLSDNYTVTSPDVTEFEQSLKPLNNLSKYSLYFLLVIFIIGGIILVVLNIFNIRERKYEIGVLTAIGMKKPKVALQFISEIFIVTLTAIIIGTAVGAVISVPVANELLESQVETTQSQSVSEVQAFGRQPGGPANIPDNMPSNTNKKVNYVSEITSATDFSVILELFGIGILLTLIASFAAVAFITRYEPLKILSNRD